MERIDVYRGQASTSEDGDLVQGPLELWRSFTGLAAPVSASESPTESSQGVTVGYTVYVRSGEPTGILDTDVIGLRGLLLPVDGLPAVWENPRGEHVGDVITVGLREG
ncbi:hypothetical protein GFD17_04395 [Bifidobacterium sp. SMB2]|uniref:Acetyl-CoA carboxylase n=1 Tax=Bifidobacterium saimiriisciurei TaxID=2661627 RepID=A0ABX0C9H9_9BIFI|nr:MULTISPECIES: hypothetical protein [Bifidobacterium]NEG96011.1 hypothetical protein [Bifidobacterium sp. SMB2]NEH10911.1 hypothetical protein [Bifidobacterium saimiriisciurei]